jgi:hypothetical protein
VLTLYTTPVIYLAFGRLGEWMFGKNPARPRTGEVKPQTAPDPDLGAEAT